MLDLSRANGSGDFAMEVSEFSHSRSEPSPSPSPPTLRGHWRCEAKAVCLFAVMLL